jgi:hypothetical protein
MSLLDQSIPPAARPAGRVGNAQPSRLLSITITFRRGLASPLPHVSVLARTGMVEGRDRPCRTPGLDHLNIQYQEEVLELEYTT